MFDETFCLEETDWFQGRMFHVYHVKWSYLENKGMGFGSVKILSNACVETYVQNGQIKKTSFISGSLFPHFSER